MSQTFFHIKNIDKLSLFKKIVLILPLTFFCHAGYSWSLFGYDNYEECLSKEMKGRDMKQESLVAASCIKKFPKLSSFTNKNKFGELNCSIDGKGELFSVSINKNLIKTYLGEFRILAREEGFIRGVNTDKQIYIEGPVGALIVINFQTGFGGLKRADQDFDKPSFVCYE